PSHVDFAWARNTDLGNQNESRWKNSEKLWHHIKTTCESNGLDAVISYCFARDLEPDLVRQTIKLGVPWINFYCDSTHRFEEVEPLARLVSLNWFPEHLATARYRALGVPYICLPYALNPEFLPELECRQSRRPLAFIGVPSANRITQLGWLKLLGCPVEIRG